MSQYLLIESQDPFEGGDVGQFAELAESLKNEGNEVTYFLVQNGVFPARPSKHSEALGRLVTAGIEVLADEFSLRERGISSDRMTPGVQAVSLGVVIDKMADGHKTMWH